MLFAVLGFGAIVLTYAMFQSRNSMLGFPCAIFWAILGGYCYLQSTATWDIYYFVFIASAMGMTIFTMLAAWGLREKRDTYAEQEIEEGGEGEGEYLGEDKKKNNKINEDSPGKRLMRRKQEKTTRYNQNLGR